MPQLDIKFPKPVGYRKEVLAAGSGQFLRYAVYDRPPGVPLYTEGQVRAIVQCELDKLKGATNDNS